MSNIRTGRPNANPTPLEPQQTQSSPRSKSTQPRESVQTTRPDAPATDAQTRVDNFAKTASSQRGPTQPATAVQPQAPKPMGNTASQASGMAALLSRLGPDADPAQAALVRKLAKLESNPQAQELMDLWTSDAIWGPRDPESVPV